MSLRKVLGFGLLGILLTMPLMYSAPAGDPQKKGHHKGGGTRGGSKKGGGKQAPTKGGRKG